ncbi:DUF2971 domain-containing protein [Vibrio parahaemolyticus]|uniref:DUF2971 domain-containing protein n=1 Tax=Vibrio parahaemolyticus TaxID=670 RepID=UPI00111F243A|nr:DUF2971 domain-containing protein [Vibrio parahaemolyticus]MDF4711249.1 DUF2971 domain-containing protein [Vibrio parahaemolyticus]TOP41058.1 hypothetical protein CGH15_22490 [Vibrio parahaemolyticus]HCE1838706.1 DUF2971 domain-containing protein [Vibrio parahaemolyticus]HCE1934557.1 DUF2971 domain-containing protein [Vibrio parahaemolyticus]HCG6960982.1 DUF2971 domain-containing protein [Vibrio parahaemolyticus]
MSIYKYVSFENLKHILNGSVRITQPKAFNDPFELLPEINLTNDINGFSLNITSSQRENEPARLPDDFESQNCNDIASRDVLNGLNKLIGIFCVSENPNSLLMWSHYAEEYKGAVVEFDENHEFFRGLFSVSYEDNRPKLDWELMTDTNGQVRLSELCYKPKDWEYEAEKRIARFLNDGNVVGHVNGHDVVVMDIPLDCIKSVTMGERMSVENQRLIFGKLYQTNIALHLAAVSNWGYTFRSEIIKIDRPISECSPQISPRTAHIFTELKGSLGEVARWLVKEHPMAEMVNKTL